MEKVGESVGERADDVKKMGIEIRLTMMKERKFFPFVRCGVKTEKVFVVRIGIGA